MARGSNVETAMLFVVVQMQYLARQVEDMESELLRVRALDGSGSSAGSVGSGVNELMMTGWLPEVRRVDAGMSASVPVTR